MGLTPSQPAIDGECSQWMLDRFGRLWGRIAGDSAGAKHSS
jgi:hypothetical protein